MKRYLKVLVLILGLAIANQGLLFADNENSTSKVEYAEIYDPLEPVNRAVLKFLTR